MNLLVLFLTFCVAAAQDDVNAFTKATNSFTPSVYKEIAKTTDGNFLVSPFSAETILALAQSGAKDETAREIRTALHLPDDNSAVESSVKAFLPTVTKNLLTTANKIYIKTNFSIHDEFRQKAAEVYQSEVQSVDFSKKKKSAKKINEWVQEHTQNRIQNVVDWKTLTNNTRAILINALYFKGNWSTTFPPMLTKKADFHKNETEVVQVDTMYLDGENLLYFECPHLDAKILELPFEGEDASTTIILPNKNNGLSALESKVDMVFAPHNLTETIVTVSLPKFRIESQFDLKTALQNLGVVKIFDEVQADLSGIAGKKGDLVISAVVQKTFIDVNEQGVEAAASTYIPALVPQMGIDNPKMFIADHPFIFYVKAKGVILFAGRVLLPEV